MDNDLSNLQQLIDRIDETAAQQSQVSLDAVVAAVGYRSFGPLVLLAGFITLAPLIGDIPGVPTLMALLVILTAGQLLFHRRSIWLPGWLVNRAVPSDKLRKGLQWCRKPARFIDRLIKPRLTILVDGLGRYLITLVCIVVALAMPLMEVIPFSANGGGAALTACGLAMIARDGLLALFAMVITVGTLVFIAQALI